MKRYLGSIITIYAAIVAPIFVICPLIFVPILLVSVDFGVAIALSLFCLACSLIWGVYIRQISRELYSWGTFKSDKVIVRTWFQPSFDFIYSKCRGCGIAYYTHGVLNSSLGTKHYYIYLSYDSFDERFRGAINKFKITQTQLKVSFRQDLFEHLILVLPPKQANHLMQDYEKYINSNGTHP